MYENEFEKKVQQNMEGLEFIPSDAVWTKVVQEINPEKDRRRPFFWIFLLAGLIVAGGGLYYSNIVRNQQGQPEGSPKSKPEREVINSPDKDFKTGRSQADPISVPAKQNDKDPIQKHLLTQIMAAQGSSAKQVSKRKNLVITIPEDGHIEENGRMIVIGELDHSLRNWHLINSLDINAPNSSSAGRIKSRIIPYWPSKLNRKGFQIGFNAGGGLSAIRQNILSSGNAAAARINGVVPAYQPSEIDPGPYWKLGLSVQYALSKNLSVRLGLGYRQMINYIHVGAYTDSVTAIFYGPRNMPSSVSLGSFTSISGFYKYGTQNRYKENYNWLDLPLSLDWLMTRYGKLPLHLVPSISASYLLNSSALQFDPNSGIYYRDNSLLERINLSGSLALMTNILSRDIIWQFGPKFEYGLNDLLSKNAMSQQRMEFIGAELLIIPENWLKGKRK